MNYRTFILLFPLVLGACGKSDNAPAPQLFKEQRKAIEQQAQ